jgi:hypothetical protein
MLSISCKKKVSSTVLKGVVFSSVEAGVVSDAKVIFFIKSLANNSFSSSYNLKEEQTVSGDGVFSFSFIKTSSDIEYKLVISKSNYQSQEILINPTSVSSGADKEVQVNIVPLGSVAFRIKSGAGSSSLDELLFTFNNQLKSGASIINQLYLGNQIDTIIEVEVIAERYNQISYVLKRNGSYYNIKDSVFCNKGLTVQKDIIY